MSVCLLGVPMIFYEQELALEVAPGPLRGFFRDWDLGGGFKGFGVGYEWAS